MCRSRHYLGFSSKTELRCKYWFISITFGKKQKTLSKVKHGQYVVVEYVPCVGCLTLFYVHTFLLSAFYFTPATLTEYQLTHV